MTKLILVESPTKSKTIQKFLGKDYRVEASYGHIRDLPKSKMGIDIEHDFEPQYVIPAEAKKRVSELKKLAQNAPEVILATDEDREGEAIAWHLVQALGLKNDETKRIVFHEITKSAIEAALKSPRNIYGHLVDAQQARRVLDRLVGYELSPFLWSKVRRGLSAGRVQSVALRLIVEREREIEKFKPEEYWTIEALLSPQGSEQKFTAKLHKIGEDTVKKFDLGTKADSDKIISDLANASYQVSEITQKETHRSPAAPFTTSTLQQEAARKLGMSSKQTMMLAQRLYETGMITYMRTDSVNLAEQAVSQAREVITQKYGANYPHTRRYKTKSKGAQEAHEAIRPTDLSVDPESARGELESGQWRIYDLIWKRTLASQMAEAVFDQTTVDISATPPPNLPHKGGGISSRSLPQRGEGQGGGYTFRATGQVMKFDGFIKAYMEGRDEESEEELAGDELPKLQTKETLALHNLEGKQHFTIPPPRYTDASLVKALEENGIGRPSTYAPTISTLFERKYVDRFEKKIKPTEIGMIVNDLLVEHFPQIVDYGFTAKMEGNLDEIAEGNLKWQPVIRGFYEPFHANLEKKEATVKRQVEVTDVPCPHCGKNMIKKFGRFGAFLACPEEGSKVTMPLPEEQEKIKALEEQTRDEKCPLCGSPMTVRRGRFGFFLGCSRYPECKGIAKIEKKLGFKCPNCGIGEIVEKKSRGRGKLFYACNRFPQCNFLLNKKPESQEELMELFESWKTKPPKTKTSSRSRKTNRSVV